MIKYERFTLDNGLTVLVHEDETTPLAAVNILYDVGSRDEAAEKTGFAHLFEHLMFEGSENIEDFDEPLQRAGGESNAFTNNDITNYYDVLPATNLETAFWLESDRMLSLDINEESLELQRKVVIEEFKENYLSQPFGDVWHLISDLAYKVHPYQWPTIGKNLEHIEGFKLNDVKHFFKKYYVPNNAIMVVGGNVKVDQVKGLSQKWFGDIPKGKPINRKLAAEPPQSEKRELEIHADVPGDALYKMYHMGSRNSDNFYVIDLVSDILASGNASILYRRLVKELRFFTEIEAYVTGTTDAGLLILEGKLVPGAKMKAAEKALDEELEKFTHARVSERELLKVKNKQESVTVFSEVNLLHRAMNLAYYEVLGDANLINTEMDKYLAVTAADVLEHSQNIFKQENSSVIYYYANKK
ncbi:pitrilysin family protein [soil metagenome]